MSLSRTEGEFYSFKTYIPSSFSYKFKHNDKNEIKFFFQPNCTILGISKVVFFFYLSLSLFHSLISGVF